MFKLIERYKLYVIPLCSIKNDGTCTCNDLNCSSPGKHPHFKFNWKLIASNDTKKIKSWMRNYENINWGVLTGRQSPITNKYLAVIDIDKKRHEILKKLPPTFSYTTGQGSHYWYWTDRPVKNSISSLAYNVDVRGSNGYVVIPPSKHVNGLSYKFLKLMNYNIADLPDLKLTKSSNKIQCKLFKKTAKVQHKAAIWHVRAGLRLGNKIANGTRNTTIHRLLSSDRARGAQEELLLNNAQKYKACCEDAETMTDQEVRRIVNSVLKYPAYRNLSDSQYNIPGFDDLIKKTLKSSKLFKTPLQDIKKHLYCTLENKNIYMEEIPDQWLAAQLMKHGYDKIRTNRGNRWMIKICI
jgi:hypothetical protein